jgi:hypothetical protein
MAAKTDQVIILPLDTGNTGKKIRTKESVVGANTVEEYYFIPSSERSTTGQYKFVIPAQAIPTAAHTGTTTGFLYLINPVSSTVKIAIDRLSFKHGFSTTLAVDLISPLIHVARISFTGTLSATATTPIKRNTVTDAAPQGLIATAMTGLTVTLVGNAWSFMGQTMDLVTGGGGHWNPMSDEYNPEGEDDEIILAPGEGIVVYSTLAVTTANRKLMINGAWFEYN